MEAFSSGPVRKWERVNGEKFTASGAFTHRMKILERGPEAWMTCPPSAAPTSRLRLAGRTRMSEKELGVGLRLRTTHLIRDLIRDSCGQKNGNVLGANRFGFPDTVAWKQLTRKGGGQLLG